ncbi:DUF5066 family protein [Enterobacteriaceae bacterium G50]|nr:DUF5066 family protein [Enterobacteriaceae bacterium G50]
MSHTLPELIEIIKHINRNPTPNPMSQEEVNRLRVRKYRDPQNNETTELPESLKALLAYDRDLISPNNQKIFSSLLRRLDENGVIHSDSPDSDAYYGNYMDQSGKSMEEFAPIWANDACLPALIRIIHPGDQGIFIYVSERDDAGEYPIARVEGFEFWMEESSLIEYLYGIFTDEEIITAEWQRRRNENEARDKALLDLESLHEQLYAKLAELDD